MKSVQIGLAALMIALPCIVLAADTPLPPCKEGTKGGTLEVAQEWSPMFASSKFGSIDQSVASISYIRSVCMQKLPGRWQLAGSLGTVSQERRGDSYVALGGGGINWPLAYRPNGASISVEPMVRLGYEKVPEGKSYVRNAEISFQLTQPMTFVEKDQAGTLLFGSLRVGRTSRTLDLNPGLGVDIRTSQRSVFVNGGFDFLVGTTNYHRIKTSLAHQSFSGIGTTNRISSAIVSFRKITNRYDDYPRNVEVWVSRGNGDYRSVLLAISWREVTRR